MKAQGARRRSLVAPVSVFLILALCGGGSWAAPTAAAGEYNPQEAGHPLKLVAYLVAPIGTLLDYGLMRPAFWLVRKEPFRTLFGYEYMAQEDDQYPRYRWDDTQR